MRATTSSPAIAASTLAKPATASPALRAKESAASAAAASPLSTREARPGSTVPGPPWARAKRRFFSAVSTALALAVTQRPRPGRRRRKSGTTCPSGATTKRISASTGAAARVTMQVRSVSCWRPGKFLFSFASDRSALGLGGRRFLFGRMEILLRDPADLDAAGHDHRLGIGARQIEAVEGARMARGLAFLALDPADELVGDRAGEILDRLDVGLAEGDQHGGGHAGDFLEGVVDAERLPLLVLLGLDPRQILAGALLELGRRLVVEALDAGDLVLLDVGDVLDGGEAFRGEELGAHLVDVERGDEELAAVVELLLATLRLFLLGEDVDVPTGELRGEAHVLAAAADGERQLLVGNDHLDAPRLP